MNNIRYAVILLVILIGCGEIIEKDISNKEVVLLAPGDSASIIGDSISLWWEYLDGARSYEVHVVSPSFASPQLVLLDSITDKNLISLKLGPGKYEWEVSALNNGYATNYYYRSFTVDTTESTSAIDISTEAVSIVVPANNAVITSTSVNLLWDEVNGADHYNVRLASPSFANANFLMDSVVSENKLNMTLSQGTYECRVRAHNESSKSNYSEVHFSVDTATVYTDLSSVQVTLLAPGDSLVTGEHDLTLWWEEVQDVDDYEVIVVTPSFENIDFLVEQTFVTDNNLEITLDSGAYEWGVRARNAVSTSPRAIHKLFINQ